MATPPAAEYGNEFVDAAPEKICCSCDDLLGIAGSRASLRPPSTRKPGGGG